MMRPIEDYKLPADLSPKAADLEQEARKGEGHRRRGKRNRPKPNTVMFDGQEYPTQGKGWRLV